MKKVIVYVLGAALVLTLVSATYAVDGGDINDPLVTQSYVDSKIDEVKTYFEGKIGTLNTNLDSVKSDLAKIQTQTPSSTFEIVSLKNGQQLVCGAGTEIILRAGYATAIGSDLGGLSDTTGGIDIVNGKDIPRNHLLIIPRDDGRGLQTKAPNNTIVMVKGSYKIQ